MTINLTIDGMAVEAREGSSILEVINAAGVYVPQLCKDPAMPAIGACRTCLVQVEGRRGFPASCHTPVSEGMVVQTNSPEVRRIRQGILDLTLGMLPTETPGEPLAEHKELKTASQVPRLTFTRLRDPCPGPHRRQQPLLLGGDGRLHHVRPLRRGVPEPAGDRGYCHPWQGAGRVHRNVR